MVSLPDFHSEPMLTDLVLDETASTSSRTTMGRRPRGAREMTCEIPLSLSMWSSNEIEFNAMVQRRVAQRMQELNHRPTLVNPNNIPVGTPIVRSDYENWRLSQRQPRIDRFNSGIDRSFVFDVMRGTYKHHGRSVNVNNIPDRVRQPQSLIGHDRRGGRLHIAPLPEPPVSTITGKIL